MKNHETPPDAVWIAAVQSRVIEWGCKHRNDYPWRDPSVPFWQRLLAEVLLLRTRADQVVPVFRELVRRFPSPELMVTITDEEVGVLISALGLRWRARLLAELMRQLAARRGEVPESRGGLLDLPAVGDYIAAAMLSLHMGQRAVIVDSNTVRIISRLIGSEFDGETRRKRWLRDLAELLTPQSQEHQPFNYGLLDLAMVLCRPKRRCGLCPLHDLCPSASPTPVGPRSARMVTAGLEVDERLVKDGLVERPAQKPGRPRTGSG